jgi:prepilin-type N-terminal cleavage/methylation domain-containing protein
MKQVESGFTLIELISVVAILVVVAATTVPRFIDIPNAAKDAAIKDIVGALTTATSLNHANNIAYDASLSSSKPLEITDCESSAELLEAGLDKQYLIELGLGISIEDGGVADEGGYSECLVAFDSNNDGVFNVTDEPRGSFTTYGVRN